MIKKINYFIGTPKEYEANKDIIKKINEITFYVNLLIGDKKINCIHQKVCIKYRYTELVCPDIIDKFTGKYLEKCCVVKCSEFRGEN